MDATQTYDDEDDDFLPTQRIPNIIEEEEKEKVGTIIIDSNEYQIKSGTTKIGRLDSCDIVINDLTVSKIHAEIEAMKNQKSRIWVRDLNSSNKTKLDDEILLPTHLYEIKDGSVIIFGRVHATYRAYRSIVIPETPAPSRKRIMDTIHTTIIPSTPDLSLINSSNDESVIHETQKDEQNSIFRQPLIPQQHQYINIDKKNISSNNDSQIVTVLHASNINNSKNQEPSTFDTKTQKFERHETVASTSIHNVETQIFSTDSSAIDIHDMETQHYTDYNINELEIQKSKNNIQNIISMKKSEINKNKNMSQVKDLDQVKCNINNLEMEKFNNKEEDNDKETQLELKGIKAARKIIDMKNQIEMNDNINDINIDRPYINKDTLTITKTTKNGVNDDNKEDNTENNTVESKTKINYDNVSQSPNSRSSSPGSLNLSSSGVDKDCLSPLQHSNHLLESSDLLEYFGEGIDKQEEIRASTPNSYTETLSKSDNNAENMSNNEDEDVKNDEDIFDALTQHIDDDLEVGTEKHSEKLANNQYKSLEISDECCNDNADHNPGTSVESEDIFNALTQQLKNSVVDDLAPTQIINNDKNIDNQDLINKTNISGINDAIKNGQKEHVDHKKTGESIQEITNDSLRKKFNEMFYYKKLKRIIDRSSDISTQILENFLESSSCDDDSSIDKHNLNKNENEMNSDKNEMNSNENEMNSNENEINSNENKMNSDKNEMNSNENEINSVKDDENLSYLVQRKYKTDMNKQDKNDDLNKTDNFVLKLDLKNILALSSLKDKKCMQTSDTYDSDDDILICIPVLNISGMFSKSVSPSISLTSYGSVSPIFVKNKKIVRNKSQCKQSIGNSQKDKNPNKILYKPLHMPNHMAKIKHRAKLRNGEMRRSSSDDDSDSDSEQYEPCAFEKTNRILNNNLNEVNVEEEGIKNQTSEKESAPNLSKDSKRDIDDELKNFSRTSSRVTRYSNKQNGENSNVSREEARVENVICDKSTKSETKSTVVTRKKTLNAIEKDIERINTRKRKAYKVIEERLVRVLTPARRNCLVKTATDRQSSNTLDYFNKTSSRDNSPVIENTKSFRDNTTVSETALEESQKTLNLKTDEKKINPRRSKRIKQKINDDDTIMSVDDINANKSCINIRQIQPQKNETIPELNISRNKILKIILNPIKSTIIDSIEDESQEVEMFMGKSLSNVQDKNLSIRETNTAKIFQKNSRLRSRKRGLNADIETNSALTESSTSSAIDNSNNTQSDDSIPKAKNRKRFATRSMTNTKASKMKETFKKPINQNSASSICDFSIENIRENSQNSIENDTLSSSESSARSKATSIRKKKKVEVTRNMRKMINDSTSSRINTSITSFPSTPSTRMRRSTSVLSTPSTAKHRVLFTGIMEDYSKIVKMLGGNKVENPAKCSILVTDKVRRTYKFLCALAKGIPIVTIDWLRESESAARFLDWKGYMLKDPAAEAKFGFRLRKSLDKAKEKKLLDGYTVVLTPNVAPPPIEELKDMVTSCGGKALIQPPNKWSEKAVIISREEDLSNAKKFLIKAPKTVTIQSTEFILSGILRQEMDFNKYRIM